MADADEAYDLGDLRRKKKQGTLESSKLPFHDSILNEVFEHDIWKAYDKDGEIAKLIMDRSDVPQSERPKVIFQLLRICHYKSLAFVKKFVRDDTAFFGMTVTIIESWSRKVPIELLTRLITTYSRDKVLVDDFTTALKHIYTIHYNRLKYKFGNTPQTVGQPYVGYEVKSNYLPIGAIDVWCAKQGSMFSAATDAIGDVVSNRSDIQRMFAKLDIKGYIIPYNKWKYSGNSVYINGALWMKGCGIMLDNCPIRTIVPLRRGVKAVIDKGVKFPPKGADGEAQKEGKYIVDCYMNTSMYQDMMEIFAEGWKVQENMKHVHDLGKVSVSNGWSTNLNYCNYKDAITVRSVVAEMYNGCLFYVDGDLVDKVNSANSDAFDVSMNHMKRFMNDFPEFPMDIPITKEVLGEDNVNAAMARIMAYVISDPKELLNATKVEKMSKEALNMMPRKTITWDEAESLYQSVEDDWKIIDLQVWWDFCPAAVIFMLQAQSWTEHFSLCVRWSNSNVTHSIQPKEGSVKQFAYKLNNMEAISMSQQMSCQEFIKRNGKRSVKARGQPIIEGVIFSPFTCKLGNIGTNTKSNVGTMADMDSESYKQSMDIVTGAIGELDF